MIVTIQIQVAQDLDLSDDKLEKIETEVSIACVKIAALTHNSSYMRSGLFVGDVLWNGKKEKPRHKS